MTSSNSTQVQITISRDGRVVFPWHDAMRSLTTLGPTDVRRASHVEYSQAGGGWGVDFSPIGGPGLPYYYPRRRDALDTERAWLDSPEGVALMLESREQLAAAEKHT